MKKVLTFGVFDYFHLGHLRLFKNCKKNGDFLIVAIQDGEYIIQYKPDAKILYSTEERLEIIQELKCVDQVIVYQSVCPEFLETIDFDVLCLGEDHTSERFIRCEEWCSVHGKEVVRMKRTPNICSSAIKKQLETE